MNTELHVLLFEDNPGDVRLIRELLADVPGSRVDIAVADTLDAGLRMATEALTDAIVLDLTLPDSQGIDTFRRARARMPHTPFIVLTGNADRELASIALREGAQDYLFKGAIDGDILMRSIRYAVDRQRAHAALERSEAALRVYRGRLEVLVKERTADLVRVNEELERATKAKSEFLASMSHELRTPLNSILGFTGIMLQGLAGELSEEQRKQLEMVRRAGARLLALVNDVLDLSRIESGRETLHCRDFGVAPLVASCVETVAPLAEAKGLLLRVRLPRVSLAMHSDEAKIHQVLVNLLANAVKFTKSGSVSIDARPVSQDTIRFDVVDTGVGISESEIERIFGEFVQLPSEEAKPEGTGLGLAISRHLAHMLEGEVTVESELGVGSRFALTVPRRCASDGPVSAPSCD